MSIRSRFTLGLSFILFFGVCDISAEENTGWTVGKSMEFHHITSTVMSPEGNLVAYTVNIPIMTEERSEYRTQIYLSTVDGIRDRQMTRGDHSCTAPAFSPDGRRLAFLTDRSGTQQIWCLYLDGGEAFQLTEEDTPIRQFQWSPDGTSIAYIRTDPEPEEIEKAKKEKRYVMLVDEQYRYDHLYRADLDLQADTVGATQRLTRGNFTVTGFDWAPNTQTLVFSHAPDPTINTLAQEQNISLVPADSGKVTALVTWPGVDDTPLFSPDGTQIAFRSQGGDTVVEGLSDFYQVSSTGGIPDELAETPNRHGVLLHWAGDGKSVYVADWDGTTRQLYQIPVKSTAKATARNVTAFEGYGRGYSFNLDGTRFSCVYGNLNQPPELFMGETETAELQQLSLLQEAVTIPPLGETVLIQWESFDGTEIEGLLTYPVEYDETRRYPLIVHIHGGPAGVFPRYFTGGRVIYVPQVFAEHNYVVLRPNPRGSTGYGKDFRFANIQDWGYGDYEDVMAGVDHVIQMGVVHPDSLAVMGWSYGGYLTSFTITRTDRFQAASMGAGLPNLVSMVTTTDIPDYLVAHMGDKELWHDYDAYEKHSAMYHVQEIQTPTQIIHGQEDNRVPYRQGQELYTALKRRGVATQMIALPRTPHGPTEPKLLMEITPRVIDWFDKQLGRQSSND